MVDGEFMDKESSRLIKKSNKYALYYREFPSTYNGEKCMIGHG
jgi:hypothetical protein